MARYEELENARDDVLHRVRAEAFATMTPRTAASTHLSLVPRIYPQGHVLDLVDTQIRVPEDSVLVFVDEMPGANFGHPCRYQFHSPEDGRLLHVEQAEFPPEVADPGVELEHFHAPLQFEEARPVVYQAVDWQRLHRWPWLVDDNRFALLFTSQISNRRHVEDLELAYRTLVHRFGFAPSNITVLCYDGTIGSTDFSGSAMSTWVGDGTAYQMKVDNSATKANLQAAFDDLSARMNSDSLLFVHTNNHGSQSGLCVDNSSVVTPAEWGTMLSGMKAFGTLVVTMEQCYSGAFSQPTLDNSQAARTSFASAVPADKQSAGGAHFDPWAQAWFEGVNGATAYGASLAHNPDTNSNGKVSAREAFNYSDAYDTNTSLDDPQYADKPVGCGASIYLTRPPSLVDVIRELLERFLVVDEWLRKHPPLPDPPPEWATELLPTLELAETLTQRLELAALGAHQIDLDQALSASNSATSTSASNATSSA